MLEPAVVGALAFAASAGVATFFAPCAFPLLPGYVGYYLSENDGDTGMLAPAGAAAGGALGALAVVALLVLAVSQPVKTALPVLEPIIGVGLIAFGIATLMNRGPELRVPLPERPASVTGFGLLGAVYAVPQLTVWCHSSSAWSPRRSHCRPIRVPSYWPCMHSG
jgi:cytochrome c-type biogenesis protein